MKDVQSDDPKLRRLAEPSMLNACATRNGKAAIPDEGSENVSDEEGAKYNAARPLLLRLLRMGSVPEIAWQPVEIEMLQVPRLGHAVILSPIRAPVVDASSHMKALKNRAAPSADAFIAVITVVERGLAYKANGYDATSWFVETVEKNSVEDGTRGIGQSAPGTKDEMLLLRATSNAGIEEVNVVARTEAWWGAARRKNSAPAQDIPHDAAEVVMIEAARESQAAWPALVTPALASGHSHRSTAAAEPATEIAPPLCPA